MIRAVPLLTALCFLAGTDQAVAKDDVAMRACNAIAHRVDAATSSEPVFLRSYDSNNGDAPIDAALRTAAFTYDNALAVIALVACGNPAQAIRVGYALRRAATVDTRLRNAYRAGAVDDKPLSNGWWDAAGNHWAQSDDQMGTSTGNLAWTALAMLTLYDSTGDREWFETARRLGAWTIANASDDSGAGGFRGGIEGDDAHTHAIGWKATEHNIDLVAVFQRLARADPDKRWRSAAENARRFVDARWANDHFLVGTLDDGATPNRDTSGLDIQFWSVLLPDAPAAWCRALTYVEHAHGVRGGFDFNADRDGLWVEGTAQAVLAYRQCTRADDASKWMNTVAAQFSPGGYVYATREPRITTGLALSSKSGSADFYYYRRPHLGATAWVALAALDWNPLAGKPSR